MVEEIFEDDMTKRLRGVSHPFTAAFDGGGRCRDCGPPRKGDRLWLFGTSDYLHESPFTCLERLRAENQRLRTRLRTAILRVEDARDREEVKVKLTRGLANRRGARVEVLEGRLRAALDRVNDLERTKPQPGTTPLDDRELARLRAVDAAVGPVLGASSPLNQARALVALSRARAGEPEPPAPSPCIRCRDRSWEEPEGDAERKLCANCVWVERKDKGLGCCCAVHEKLGNRCRICPRHGDPSSGRGV